MNDDEIRQVLCRGVRAGLATYFGEEIDTTMTHALGRAKMAKKPGRPIKAPTAGKRASLGLKVTPETKTRLDKAAERNGRTQSQEAEARLIRSFEREDMLPEALTLAFGRTGARMLLMLGELTCVARRPGFLGAIDEESSWLDDPNAIRHFRAAVDEMLDRLKSDNSKRRDQIRQPKGRTPITRPAARSNHPDRT